MLVNMDQKKKMFTNVFGFHDVCHLILLVACTGITSYHLLYFSFLQE